MAVKKKIVVGAWTTIIMTKFLEWLFPERYSETAKCAACGAVVSKTRMVQAPSGWFCNEEEAYEYWISTAR
jgi:hypothetical protein